MDPMNFGLLALVLAALPTQSEFPSSCLHPITAPVRNAGILHVASGTWTRKSATASIGADVVYDNTCSSGFYYSPLSGDTYLDEGRLPSPTSPTNSGSRPGCAAQYTIDGLQIAYCTDLPNPQAFVLSFYESYTFCTSVIGVTPTATRTLTGVPGAPGGAFTCWIATIDLDAPPQTTSQTFVMAADGDGSYDGNEANNRFGWSIRSTEPPAAQIATGPIAAGEPSMCDHFDGTRWDSVVNYAESGTGMGSAPGFYIEGGLTPPGCYFFHGLPFGSLYLELYADACVGGLVTTFCYGDGSGTACPCGNFAAVGVGCANSLGIGAGLTASGTSSISADTVILAGTQMPANSPVLYFQGTVQQSAGAGQVFGDGKRCAGGTILRLGVKTNSAAGTSSFPGPGDPSVHVRGQITVPGTRTYQAWYRNAASFCTSATFNLSNGVELAWGI